MAFSFAKLNKRKFNVDTSAMSYVSLETLYNEHGADMVYPLLAVYINTKSEFGDSPVFVTTDCMVNIPHHMVDIAEQILASQEAIDGINEERAAFQIYQYTASNYGGRICYGVTLIDM